MTGESTTRRSEGESKVMEEAGDQTGRWRDEGNMGWGDIK